MTGGSSVAEEQFSQRSQWEFLASVAKDDSMRAQSLMLHAYSCLAAPDGIYSCQAGKSTDPQLRYALCG